MYGVFMGMSEDDNYEPDYINPHGTPFAQCCGTLFDNPAVAEWHRNELQNRGNGRTYYVFPIEKG